MSAAPMSIPRTGLQRLTRIALLIAVCPVIVWATVRVSWLERRLDLAALASHLRRTGRFPIVSGSLPGDLLAGLDWLLPWIPDRALGHCYRRSLALLDLWSRCGLEPRLHLGARPIAGGGLEAHAWVVTAAGPSTHSLGYSEILVL